MQFVWSIIRGTVAIDILLGFHSNEISILNEITKEKYPNSR